MGEKRKFVGSGRQLTTINHRNLHSADWKLWAGYIYCKNADKINFCATRVNLRSCLIFSQDPSAGWCWAFYLAKFHQHWLIRALGFRPLKDRSIQQFWALLKAEQFAIFSLQIWEIRYEKNKPNCLAETGTGRFRVFYIQPETPKISCFPCFDF